MMKEYAKLGFMTKALHSGHGCGMKRAEKMQSALKDASPWLSEASFESLAFEASFAALDGGNSAVAFASSYAAWSCLLRTLCTDGTNVILSSRVCCGTRRLICRILEEMGAAAKFVDSDHPCQTEQNIDDDTRAVITESLAAPMMSVAPLEALSRVARRQGVPLVIINTLATSALCRPIEFGAHVTVTEAAPFAASGGASACVVTDGANFDWREWSEKFPQLTRADAEFGGASFSSLFGEAAFGAKMRFLAMRGANYMTSEGEAERLRSFLRTLGLRMGRQSENALAAAKFLAAHELVCNVRYPGLAGHPQNDMAQVYLKNGCGAVLSFELKRREAQKEFMEALRLISAAASPEGMTSTLFKNEEAASRLCLAVGCEEAADITADLDQALNAALARL